MCVGKVCVCEGKPMRSADMDLCKKPVFGDIYPNVFEINTQLLGCARNSL